MNAYTNAIEELRENASVFLTEVPEQAFEFLKSYNEGMKNPVPEWQLSRIMSDLQHGSWPSSIKEDALHGLVGDFVRAIEPSTEADIVALLLHFLVNYGHIVGREAWWEVEDTKHYLNLYTLIVGETGSSRKGTAKRRSNVPFERLLRKHNSSMASDKINEWEMRTKGGLSSGEGLIWAVRDSLGADDPGVNDKRLLVVEEEFASALKVMSRQGNTLSPVIRQAWDGENLETITKNSPAKATSPHISIVGHITKQELRRHLEETEMANGFANRFLFALVRRSKKLPFGGKLPDERIEPIVDILEETIKFGRNLVFLGSVLTHGL